MDPANIPFIMRMESRQPIAISGTPVPSLLLAVFNVTNIYFRLGCGLTCFHLHSLSLRCFWHVLRDIFWLDMEYSIKRLKRCVVLAFAYWLLNIFLANEQAKCILIHTRPFVLQSCILLDTRSVFWPSSHCDSCQLLFFLEKLKELWVIPIWFIIVTATSMVVGRVLGSLFRLRPSQRFVSFHSLFFLFSLMLSTGASLSQLPCSWTRTLFQSLSCKVSSCPFQIWCGEVMTIKMLCLVVLWHTLRCIAPLEWWYVFYIL